MLGRDSRLYSSPRRTSFVCLTSSPTLTLLLRSFITPGNLSQFINPVKKEEIGNVSLITLILVNPRKM